MSRLPVQPGGVKLSFLLFAVGGMLYGAYVVGGVVFGLTTLTQRLPTGPGIQAPVPLLPPGIEFPRISLPVLTSPLALVPDWSGVERVNILVLGVDQREDEREIGLPTRSDTMIVVSVDPVQKTAALISFPRDLWVAIPGFGEERINAAFRIGELRKVEGGGPALAAQTVERNFGIRASYYLLVDFSGFEQIIDTVGGVVIDVPRPLKDDEYPTDDYGTERIYFQPGPQLMNGSTALKYARTRHADSDFARMARQQQVLMALRDRALRLNMLAQLPSLIDQASKAIRTNLSPTELLSLAKLAGQIDSDALSSLVIERDLVTSFTGIGGASLLAPRRAEIQRAIQQALADPRIVAEGARVEVVAPPRLAAVGRQAAERLTAAGLSNIRVVNVSGAEPDLTQVTASVQKPRSANAVLSALGLPPTALIQATAEGSVDIRVVVGRDLDARGGL